MQVALGRRIKQLCGRQDKVMRRDRAERWAEATRPEAGLPDSRGRTGLRLAWAAPTAGSPVPFSSFRGRLRRQDEGAVGGACRACSSPTDLTLNLHHGLTGTEVRYQRQVKTKGHLSRMFCGLEEPCSVVKRRMKEGKLEIF